MWGGWGGREGVGTGRGARVAYGQRTTMVGDTERSPTRQLMRWRSAFRYRNRWWWVTHGDVGPYQDGAVNIRGSQCRNARTYWSDTDARVAPIRPRQLYSSANCERSIVGYTPPLTPIAPHDPSSVRPWAPLCVNHTHATIRACVCVCTWWSNPSIRVGSRMHRPHSLDWRWAWCTQVMPVQRMGSRAEPNDSQPFKPGRMSHHNPVCVRVVRL